MRLYYSTNLVSVITWLRNALYQLLPVLQQHKFCCWPQPDHGSSWPLSFRIVPSIWAQTDIYPTFLAARAFLLVFSQGSDSLLCAGVVNFTVVENSAWHVVAHCSSTDIDEPVGLHWAVAAASHQHAGFDLPRLGSCIVALEKVQSRAACRNTYRNIMIKCFSDRIQSHNQEGCEKFHLVLSCTHLLLTPQMCRSCPGQRRLLSCHEVWVDPVWSTSCPLRHCSNPCAW